MLRASEWIIVVYAAYLLALLPFRPVPRLRRIALLAGSVVGEYHYVGDAMTGAAVGLAAWGAVALM